MRTIPEQATFTSDEVHHLVAKAYHRGSNDRFPHAVPALLALAGGLLAATAPKKDQKHMPTKGSSRTGDPLRGPPAGQP